MRRLLQRYGAFAKRCLPRPSLETNATLWGVRNFSDGFRDGGTKNNIRVRSESPFEVLGVSKTATYAEVKQRFLKLALEHHPDHNDKDDAASNEQFIRYRRAFESLKEGMDGRVAEGANTESSWSSDEEFLAWYYQETGKSNDIDLQTRKEVIEVFKKSSQSGLDRGGIWEWARRMAEEEAMALDKKHTFRRTVGLKEGSQGTESGSNSNQSPLRRRRKKPR